MSVEIGLMDKDRWLTTHYSRLSVPVAGCTRDLCLNHRRNERGPAKDL